MNSFDGLPRREGVAQLEDGLLEYGMTCFGGNLGERLQDETALVKFRMRDDEVRNVDYGTAEEQDVQVYEARPLCVSAAAAQFLFNGLKSCEQLARHKVCFQSDCAVDEPGLGEVVDRLSFEERGCRFYGTEGCELLQRRRQIRDAVAEV